MVSYYQNEEYLSNSTLGYLQDCLKGKTETEAEHAAKMKNYAFGNLLDFLITEPEKVNKLTRTIEVSEGEFITFSAEQFYKAEKMKEAFYNNPLCMMIYNNSQTQKEFYKTLKFEYKGLDITQKFKCKLDLYPPKLNFDADIKSTAAETDAAFMNACKLFNYDRQGSLYIDITGKEKFILIGISKKFKKHQTPKVFIYQFDKAGTDKEEFYKSGSSKYKYLTYQYQTLIA